jgi:hypothetical protein
MQKKIKDGMVAVLYSPGFGAGWYSWHGNEELLYDPKLVDMVLEKTSAKTIELYCEEVYGKNHYYGGAENLEVMWVSVGTPFRVEEYGGAETIAIRDEIDWKIA